VPGAEGPGAVAGCTVRRKGGEVSRIRRIGLRPDPPGGWPLDEVFVGVATLRTMREVFRQRGYALRAWDAALWSGVTPQGSANSLDRLSRLGLVETIASPGPGHARSFRLAPRHPLVDPVAHLFRAERGMVRRACPRGARVRQVPPHPGQEVRSF